jgi:hypothetical protein
MSGKSTNKKGEPEPLFKLKKGEMALGKKAWEEESFFGRR